MRDCMTRLEEEIGVYGLECSQSPQTLAPRESLSEALKAVRAEMDGLRAANVRLQEAVFSTIDQSAEIALVREELRIARAAAASWVGVADRQSRKLDQQHNALHRLQAWVAEQCRCLAAGDTCDACRVLAQEADDA